MPNIVYPPAPHGQSSLSRLKWLMEGPGDATLKADWLQVQAPRATKWADPHMHCRSGGCCCCCCCGVCCWIITLYYTVDIYIYYPTFGIMCLKCGMITSNMKILTTTHHGVSRISSENSASFDTELRCLWLFPSLTGLRRRHLEAEALVIF
jgi:hypothetical protein